MTMGDRKLLVRIVMHVGVAVFSVRSRGRGLAVVRMFGCSFRQKFLRRRRICWARSCWTMRGDTTPG